VALSPETSIRVSMTYGCLSVAAVISVKVEQEVVSKMLRLKSMVIAWLKTPLEILLGTSFSA
ncbi:hypothetical protein PJJ30_29425, partial [Mycobacterium kansasii]